MSIEFIGMIRPRRSPKSTHRKALRSTATMCALRAGPREGRLRPRAGPHHSTGPSATLTIAYAAAQTEKIHFMLAHRPGFTSPTLAARQIATLDQFSGGRLGVHFISGGSTTSSGATATT
jgi:alkanesulfonate monooxygenase